MKKKRVRKKKAPKVLQPQVAATKAAQIDEILFPNNPEERDGIWGPKHQKAIEYIYSGGGEEWNDATGTSFADPADIAAFKRCKAKGFSDMVCFQYGDNGIGLWGDSTVEGTGPSVALAKKRWEHLWHPAGTKVLVRYKDKVVEAQLKDSSGTRDVCDMNPDTCAALGLKPPVKEPVKWRFA